MNNQIWEMARDEAVSDLMMELCISESEARERLNRMLNDNPNCINHLYKQFYNIRDFIQPRERL